MRFASFERDNWELRSGEQSHRDYPETFALPPLEQRRSLKRGQAAKLIFDIQADGESGPVLNGERIWVIVSEQIGDSYIGILDSQPACISQDSTAYLCFGAEISFAPEHVIEIAEPPPDYVEWQLSQPPEKVWPRNDGE